MGFFSGLDAERYDRQYSDKLLVYRLIDYFKPYSSRLVLVTFLVLLIAFASAAAPVLVSKSIDFMEEKITSKEIAFLCTAVLFVGLIIWSANWLRRRIVVRIIGNIVLELRTDAFKAASEHDLSFYDEFSSGKIVSRITSDTQEFGQTVLLITDLFAQILQAVILGFILVYINWRLALILFAFLPVLFLTAYGFRGLARKVTRRGMQAMAFVNATIKESVSGIAIAKNFRQETSIYEEFNSANLSSYKVNVQRGLVLSSVFPTLNILSGIGSGLLVYIGGYNVTLGVITAGAWLLFLQSLDSFFFPVLNLTAFWAQVQSGLSASERVFALMDVESNLIQVDNQNVAKLSGDIKFRDLCFQYGSKEPVLENFNLYIRSGETVALVGHTGAGKSTIAKLIARFYEYQDGQILIDDRDIRSLNLHEYRAQLGIVSQVPFLFSGTVVENICYTCPGKNDVEMVEEMAYRIGRGEWLETLSEGLDTQVGERGSQLSMGQRQLISLMRVLVQKPAIFILDEATASVDPFTESQIQEALGLIFAETTSILIAHRLSTVKAADRIIVLDKGRIIEEGSHSQLLQAEGEYSRLYNTYFRHQSLEYVENFHQFVNVKK